MKGKKYLIFTTLLLVFLMIPSVAFADFGPKDRLEVTVKNPPDELYYLDLLHNEYAPYDNFTEEDRANLDISLAEKLRSYESEGWYPALYVGSGVPLFGKLTSEDGTHIFSYFGLPYTYRIIIVTESGEIKVSEAMTRKSLQSSVIFDYATGEIIAPSIITSYALQYISTYIPTLIIEGIILILLGYSSKQNAIVFVLTNAFTQIILTLTTGRMLINGGYTFGYLRFFPIEMAILVIEAVIYAVLLKGSENKPKTHERKSKITYAVIANLASWIISMIFLKSQFQWLVGFM